MDSLSRERQIEIEYATVELLQDFNVNEFPISISKLAELLGIKLVPCSSLSQEERNLALAASNDAFHVRTYDFMHTCIVFDDTNGAYYHRSRFSGGHEIGHIVLEHNERTPNREREADYFSGYLLAPHPLVIRCRKGFSISDVFGVSSDCASYARRQADARLREGAPWRPHEKWLLDNAVWKGGGLLGSI